VFMRVPKNLLFAIVFLQAKTILRIFPNVATVFSR
jgi:hypothetical protein